MDGAQNINPYNRHILRRWRGNMDLQFVGESSAAAAYVCAYTTKTETDSHRAKIDRALESLSERDFAAEARLMLTAAKVHGVVSKMEKAMSGDDAIATNDRQLACARVACGGSRAHAWRVLPGMREAA